MRRELVLLEEMIDAAEQVMALVRGHGVADLAGDRLRRDALLWNYTVLGEAATALPAEYRAAHTSVNWSRPIRLRNRIVHGYWSVDLDILITTAEVDLPDFVAGLRALVQE